MRNSLFSSEATVEMVHDATFRCDVLNFGGHFATVFTLRLNRESNVFASFHTTLSQSSLQPLQSTKLSICDIFRFPQFVSVRDNHLRKT